MRTTRRFTEFERVLEFGGAGEFVRHRCVKYTE